MPKYIIERNIPQAGNFSPEMLRGISRKSKEILSELGTDIQWIHSYVAGDKIYCIFIAPSEELIVKHAEMAGFPVNKVTKVSAIVEPATAE
jgi:hypothetical protein